MNVSEDGQALIKRFESCRLESYPDPKTGGAPWTIGWGHTGLTGPGEVWTQEEADRQFTEDLGSFEQMLIARTIQVFGQGQFDALVSFLYNVGPGRIGVKDGLFALKATGQPSTLLTKFRVGNIIGAADEFLKWVNPGSSVERGLRRRRVAERALFLGEDWREALDNHIESGG